MEKRLWKLAVLGVLGLALAGCSQRQVYELIRENRLEACERNPAAAADNCKQSVTGPYQEYEEVLEELDAPPLRPTPT
jgi:hypothetical protein